MKRKRSVFKPSVVFFGVPKNPQDFRGDFFGVPKNPQDFRGDFLVMYYFFISV